jgi:hypothetical protein
MASTITACAGRLSFGEFTAAGIEPPELARHKLDRLRELRAVIDTLRCEREARDPLLAWIVEREAIENQQHG